MVLVMPDGTSDRGLQESGVLRKMLLAVFLLGAVGTGVELVLLEHYSEPYQLIPLGMILIGIVVLAAWCLSGAPAVLRAFQGSMLLFILAGALGVYLHFDSNVEFELEMNPSAGGWPLVWASLTGAMPALAPGTMVHLGLVGLLFTYRHPVLAGCGANAFTSPGGDEQH